MLAGVTFWVACASQARQEQSHPKSARPSLREKSILGDCELGIKNLELEIGNREWEIRDCESGMVNRKQQTGNLEIGS